MTLEVKQSFPIICEQLPYEPAVAVITPVIRTEPESGDAEITNCVACKYARTKAQVMELLASGGIKGNNPPDTKKKVHLKKIDAPEDSADDDAFCISLDQKGGKVRPCLFGKKVVENGRINLKASSN